MAEELVQGAALEAFKEDPRVIADGLVLGLLELGVVILSAVLPIVSPEDAPELAKIRDILAVEHQAKLGSLA